MKKIFFIALSVILFLIVIAVSAFYIMRYTGEKKLRESGSPPNLPSVEDSTFDVTSNEDDFGIDESSYSVRYNGKKYKYNESMISILFMGIDSEVPLEENELYGHGGQVDVLFVACIDTDNKKVQLLQIPRDTVCDVEVFDYYGNSAGISRLPISLSHAYGDGGQKSGEITANAVSELLYGLKVNAWISVNLLALPVINDSIGGVTVIADEGNVDYMQSNTNIGDAVLLKGNYVKKFIVHRYDGNDSTRHIRQKQYLTSFISTAKKAIKKNPSLVLDIYNSTSKWTCTTLSVDEIVWLASEMLEMEINTDFITLKGEEKVSDNRVEYHIDEKALYETILKIFYVEVE